VSAQPSFTLRPLIDTDVAEYADLLFSALNTWYWKHGLNKDFYGCEPIVLSIFDDIYNDISPGCSVAVYHQKTECMMEACFYHPREYHVSPGNMSMQPNCSRKGVGRAMVDHILDFTRRNEYKACRLVNSPLNLNSYSFDSLAK
jgi:GNAT superfamily N-acetyltransferase